MLKAIKGTTRHNETSQRYCQVRTVKDRKCQGQSAHKNRDCCVPLALARSVGVPTVHLLSDESGNVREGSQQRNFEIALAREVFQNGWQPERNAVTPRHGAEVATCQKDHITMTQCFPNTDGLMLVLRFFLSLQLGRDPRLLVVG